MATTTQHMAIRDVEVASTPFRMMRRPGSAFVGLLRMGRVAGGELFGYVARLNSNRPVFQYFPRFAGWHGNRDQLDQILHCALVFHHEMTTTESRDVGDR